MPPIGPYQNASTLLNKYLSTNNTSLKQIYFNTKSSSSSSNNNKLYYTTTSYAIVSEVLKHLPILEKIVEKYSIENRNIALTYILLYEVLFSKFQKIKRCGGVLVRKIKSIESELRNDELLLSYYDKNNLTTAGMMEKNNAIAFPRYVRVNTCKISLKEGIELLKTNLGSDLEIYHDAHVHNLLVLSPSIKNKLHQYDNIMKNGNFILQDKASCLPGLILMHDIHIDNTMMDNKDEDDQIHVMDACSAPGNKTSHIASFLFNNHHNNNINNNKIYAVERDKKRHTMLCNRMNIFIPQEHLTKNNITLINDDFLKLSSDDYPNINYLLLDPSCSSSGIINTAHEKKTKDDIIALSNFQYKALKHAMTNFTNVKRIVYSTCSIHIEENEMVVSKCINECNNDNEDDWMIVDITKNCFVNCNNWIRRGKTINETYLSKEQTDYMIRCDATDGDETNGFFVCLLERRSFHSQHLEKNKNKITNCDGNPSTDNFIEGIPVYNGQFRNNDSVNAAAKASNIDVGKTYEKQKQHEEINVSKADASSSRKETNADTRDNNEDELVTNDKQKEKRIKRKKEKKDKSLSSPSSTTTPTDHDGITDDKEIDEINSDKGRKKKKRKKDKKNKSELKHKDENDDDNKESGSKYKESNKKKKRKKQK